ncbi:murein hydrolase activator EnvC family protein [Thermomonospora cellulosilytica]|uniref:Murein DD-endopeptidase MepM/ murein hydrolase activator NlpD n=1 Tax=Thermomonospora cellulosilytica TaxID=1411118 RepID=A0A7W3N3Z6_9ACTN|nr:M23 family metallopeptidase [Thermomonospora cellulosilytica]MBA9007100.1 murein DD-endopeptidase MepM/ murein hydrolase activator NlpD [Thermomonospora cellulosilytica]
MIPLILAVAVTLAPSVPSVPSVPPVPPPRSGQWRWPLSPVPAVIRTFDPPSTPWGAGHRGVDLAAAPGRPVYAAGTGRVSFAGHVAGYGVVAITHGRVRTTYLPVEPSVRVGRPVAAGTRIGTVQDRPGHCGLRHCLHWGLRHGLLYLDPLSLLRFQVRLLPIWPPSSPSPYLH